MLPKLPRFLLGSTRRWRVRLKAWPSLRVRCSGCQSKHLLWWRLPGENVIWKDVKVRDGEATIASTRVACAPRNDRGLLRHYNDVHLDELSERKTR